MRLCNQTPRELHPARSRGRRPSRSCRMRTGSGFLKPSLPPQQRSGNPAGFCLGTGSRRSLLAAFESRTAELAHSIQHAGECKVRTATLSDARVLTQKKFQHSSGDEIPSPPRRLLRRSSVCRATRAMLSRPLVRGRDGPINEAMWPHAAVCIKRVGRFIAAKATNNFRSFSVALW
jgi:hypothetical protein